MKKLLLSAADVAQMMSMSERTVWKLVKSKDLPPPLKIKGRLTRWHRSAILRYVRRLVDSAEERA